MGLTKFHEYMEKKDKVLVKTVADYEGDSPKAPKKPGMPKNAGGVGAKDEPRPYQSTSTAQDPNAGKYKDGFAKTGDERLVYKPAVGAYGGNSMASKSVSGVPGGKKLPTYPVTTQEWVNKTKNLSLAEFTQKIRAEALEGVDECGCGVSPVDAINQVVSYCKCNPKNVQSLVREMKRNELFGLLVKELARHEETFKTLSQMVESRNVYAQRFAVNLLESVDKPLGMDGEHGMSQSDNAPKGLPSPDDDDDQHDDEEDDHDDHDDHDDAEGSEDHDEMGDDDQGDMEGSDDHEEDHHDDSEDHEDHGDADFNLQPHEKHPLPKHLRPMMNRM